MEKPHRATSTLVAEAPAAQSLHCSNAASHRVTELLSGVCQAELRCLLLNFLFFKHPNSPSFTDKHRRRHLELPTSSGRWSGVSHPGPRHALLPVSVSRQTRGNRDASKPLHPETLNKTEILN